jgi:hypothetical protein
MCFNTNFGFCIMRPKRKCCLCIAAVRSVKIVPLVDLLELIVQVPLLVATLVAQDTWMAHYLLVLAVNILATVVKLVGSVSIFCAGIPGG